MFQRIVFLTIAALLTLLVTTSEAKAWGCYHAGYTHYSPYTGLHHYGYTTASRGYSSYRGYHYGGYHYGAYGGGARYGYYRRY